MGYYKVIYHRMSHVQTVFLFSAITPMVQCAKVVSMTPQDGAAANNWRKANKGVSV